MAGFCSGCGSALGDGVKFCEKCGTPVPAPVAAPTATPTPASVSAAPSQPSNTGIKIIFAVLAVVVFLGLLMAGSCFYVAYKFKKKAQELSSSLGTDAPRYTGKRDPCALLSGEDATQALGETVSSVEPLSINGCQYQYGDHGHLGVQYAWRGGAMAMRMTQGAIKQIPGMNSFTPVPDLGDEAYLAPMNSELLMRKGDVLVTIELQSSGVSPDAAKKVAAKIADHL